MSAGIRRFLILLAVFVAAFLSVFVIRKLQKGYSLADIFSGKAKGNTYYSEEYTLKDKPALELDDVKVLAAINAESASIVRAVVPSVVSIDTTGVRHERLRDIWGQTWFKPKEVQGQGSGVIVTQEGHVLTNYHVIKGNPRIRLTMHDGSVHSAKVIGSDPAVDIAVLKIDAKGPFVPLKFGDSGKTEVGHAVFAVGSPFGLGESVTEGKISAKKRSFTDSQVDLLQTSAAINPGNSGGPLVNIQGEIIGINSRIYSTDRKNPGFQGIGFAIPANAAKKTMQDILDRGRPIRGYLGMALANLDPYAREEFNFQESDGVRVRGVVPKSPAENADLRENDIITRYKGEKVNNLRRLIALIQQSKVGSEATLEIWREGATHTVTATVGEADDFNQQLGKGGQQTEPRRLDNRTILHTIGISARNPTSIER
ncbi:MAG: S1C family serine protease, partial [Akkermansiaceae bacterium]